VSAVSLDEEMINLIKYQQAYTAASKLLSVSDEMLIALINSR
jgi:flagellar hook-associated protein 1 FlgK